LNAQVSITMKRELLPEGSKRVGYPPVKTGVLLLVSHTKSDRALGRPAHASLLYATLNGYHGTIKTVAYV